MTVPKSCGGEWGLEGGFSWVEGTLERKKERWQGEKGEGEEDRIVWFKSVKNAGELTT